MDFWAQHKDFVVRVLAGLVVFLVALIARGVVYGDELEKAQATNRGMVREVRKSRIAKVQDIQALEQDRDELRENANTIAGQVGFLGTREELVPTLIERTLGYLRRYIKDKPRLPDAARAAGEQIKANLNGGFGELRLLVQDELGDEASERDIRVDQGFGFEDVTQLGEGELERYLLQLELTTRILRYCIDEQVDAIEEVRIERRRVGEVIPGANPEFMREYPVRVRFKSTQKAATGVLRRLQDDSPAVPLRGLRIDRTKRPRDHVLVELTALALATTLDEKVPFVIKEGQQ